MRTDYSQQLCTDEVREALYGPGGWTWGCTQGSTEVPCGIQCQKRGSDMMTWARIINKELVDLIPGWD